MPCRISAEAGSVGHAGGAASFAEHRRSGPLHDGHDEAIDPLLVGRAHVIYERGENRLQTPLPGRDQGVHS